MLNQSYLKPKLIVYPLSLPPSRRVNHDSNRSASLLHSFSFTIKRKLNKNQTEQSRLPSASFPLSIAPAPTNRKNQLMHQPYKITFAFIFLFFYFVPAAGLAPTPASR
nr:MAG TPA: hypothetical protein [Caudoviricetes sp.]